MAFVDPVKVDVPEALARLAEHGVAVKMLTGDSARVAEQVCGQAGIPVGRIVLGREVAAAAAGAAVLVGLPLPRSPWAAPLQMTPPPASLLPWLVVIVGAYLLAAQLAKIVFIRRTGHWI